MAPDALVNLLQEMLYVGLLLLLPPVGAALVTGLVIGLLQAVTSIQEQTLTFVPKVLAIALVFIVLGGWMARILISYSTELYHGLPEFGAL